MGHSLAVARPSLILYDAHLEPTVLAAISAMTDAAAAKAAAGGEATTPPLARLARLDSSSLDGANDPGSAAAFPEMVGVGAQPATAAQGGPALDASAGLLQSSRVVYPRARRAGVGFRDPWGYIYTSGTTGLPKAAVLTAQRFLIMSWVLPSIAGLTADDVLYTALPLFHSAGEGMEGAHQRGPRRHDLAPAAAGGCIGIGTLITRGTTVVIAPKFSASSFWPDCVQSKATAIQYIGEVRRPRPFSGSEG